HVQTGIVIPAPGHQGLIPAFAATCTTAGNSEISGTCTREGCGQTVTGTVIPALGHTFGTWTNQTAGIWHLTTSTTCPPTQRVDRRDCTGCDEYQTRTYCRGTENLNFSNNNTLGNNGTLTASHVCIPDFHPTALTPITAIGAAAFTNNSFIKTIRIPAGLTSINQQSFRDSGITNITIPAGITTIGGQTFSGCSDLTTVTFAPGSLLVTIGNSAFRDSRITNITIPAGVTIIDSHAFYNCTNLSTVTFAPGSQLITIGNSAFQDNELTNITIPAGVTSIGNNAFHNCTNLSTITFAGSQLETIGNSAFENTGLTNITIPASVTSIGLRAFWGSRNLRTVTILRPSTGGSFNGTALSVFTSFTDTHTTLRIIVPTNSAAAYRGADQWNNSSPPIILRGRIHNENCVLPNTTSVCTCN
ncbi:MAG: leucine-rich repeat domain-containing protein, partial [Treponema sp.]|nr:leucine-rich repeat domain-containing protein [Treponema sp.]